MVLAALGLAATAAPQALAAEGGAPSLLDAAQLAAGALEQAGLGDVPPTLAVEPAAPPLDVALELPAATAQQAAAEPVTTGAGAAPPPVPVAAPTPERPEQALAGQAPAPDPPPPAEPAAPTTVAPPAGRDAPVNVNVSVRVDSPGGDGAVTQVNVAAAAPPDQYPPDQYRSDPARYQPVLSADTPAADAAASPDSAGEEAWEWSLSPGCGGVPVASVAVPARVLVTNWIWKWRWNCAGDEPNPANNEAQFPKRYQPVVAQYRPVNINVSIRINSPGSNGPVAQANVAVVVQAPPVPLAAPVAAAQPLTALPVAASEWAPSGLDVPETLLEAPDGAELLGLPTPSAVEEPVEHLEDCCLLPEPRGLAFAVERPAPPIAGGDAATAAGGAPLPGDPVAVAARLELRLRAQRPSAAAASPSRPQLRPARSTTPRGRPTEETSAAVTQGGTGIAPVGGPDRSLPFAALVFLGFLFASASSSLASVRSRPTPGADADDPPDRPG